MGTQKQTKKNEDQFGNEFLSEANVLVEVKVSEDDGGTWHRGKISMVSGLEEYHRVGKYFRISYDKAMDIANITGFPRAIFINEKPFPKTQIVAWVVQRVGPILLVNNATVNATVNATRVVFFLASFLVH